MKSCVKYNSRGLAWINKNPDIAKKIPKKGTFTSKQLGISGGVMSILCGEGYIRWVRTAAKPYRRRKLWMATEQLRGLL
jgi:hypothetical protein